MGATTSTRRTRSLPSSTTSSRNDSECTVISQSLHPWQAWRNRQLYLSASPRIKLASARRRSAGASFRPVPPAPYDATFCNRPIQLCPDSLVSSFFTRLPHEAHHFTATPFLKNSVCRLDSTAAQRREVSIGGRRYSSHRQPALTFGRPRSPSPVAAEEDDCSSPPAGSSVRSP